MAGCSKQYDFIFDGGLQSHTRASLINEVIKHLLLERNQIPQQFDILRQHMTVNEAVPGLQDDGSGRKPVSSHNHTQDKTNCKARSLISSLDILFDNILKAFETCPEIQQALVLLGSTAMTPKECYAIHLPHICPEATNISLKASKQALFRHLVSEQILSSSLPLGPTNIYVALRAPCFASLQGFLPKQSFKMPVKGHRLILNMICNQPSFGAQELTLNDTEVEISGVEPFERSSVLYVCDVTPPVIADHMRSPSPVKLRPVMDSSFEEGCGLLQGKHVGSLPGDGGRFEFDPEKLHFNTPLTRSTPKVRHNNNSVYDQNMFIWFQCSTVIKGYRI